MPPKTLTDGSEVRIRIVEGAIETIDARAVPPRVRAIGTARAAKLVGRKGMTLEQIERHLLLAAHVPGVNLESVVVPGQDVGGAVLVLKAQWKPVAGMLAVDNRLSNSYDKANFDAQLVANSVLGLGEQVYGVVATASDFALFERGPLRRITDIGAIMPIGTDGLSLNAEYIHADTNPKVPKRATTDCSLQRSGPTGHKPCKAGGILGIETSFTQGLDVFDARNAGDVKCSGGVLLSRFSSKPVFSKLHGTVTARGQVTLSGALPSSAQFPLDAGDGLSGFNLGSVNVDSGGTVRSGLARAVPLESIGLTDIVATQYRSAPSAGAPFTADGNGTPAGGRLVNWRRDTRRADQRLFGPCRTFAQPCECLHPQRHSPDRRRVLPFLTRPIKGA